MWGRQPLPSSPPGRWPPPASSAPRIARPRGSCSTRAPTTRTCTRSWRRTRRGKLTVVSNWVPLESPAGGPYFGKLDPEAHYYVKIDNTGDGVEDVAYRWRFKNTFRNPDSFLYAVPPVNSINDREPELRPDLRPLLHPLPRRQAESPSARSRNDVPVAPDNVGPKTLPELRERRRTARSADLRKRRQDVRRPGRRPVLHRPRRDLRRHQHRQARPADDRPRQPGRRQGRRLGLQHARVRAAGAVVRAVTRDGKDVKRPEGRQRRRRRLGDHRAPARSRSTRATASRSGSRSAGSGTR